MNLSRTEIPPFATCEFTNLVPTGTLLLCTGVRKHVGCHPIKINRCEELVGNASSQNLRRVMEPKSVAIVGISGEERSIGGYVLSNLQRLGYRGDIHLVSRNAKSVRGIACVPTIDEIPEGVDVAVLALPEPAIGPSIRALGAKGAGGAIVFAAGFAEAGQDGIEKQRELVATSMQSGVCLIGPNCMGFTNFISGAGLTFDTVLPMSAAPAGVAIVAQSGAMANNLREAMSARGIGISFAVSTGNEAAVGTEDFIDYCLDNESTSLIAVYAEQIKNGRRLLELARKARSLGKPLVVFLIGRSARAKESAQSHTGALTGDYATARALLSSEAVLVPQTMDEMMDVIPLLLQDARPRPGGVAFVTGSGATKNIALDVGSELGLDFPEFSAQTQEELKKILPSYALCENPLDYTTVAIKDPGLMSKLIDTVSTDPGCACMVVAQVPGSAVNQNDKAEYMVPAVLRSRTPSALAILGDSSPLAPPLEKAMAAPGLAAFRSLDRCLKAIALQQSFAVALKNSEEGTEEASGTRQCVESAYASPATLIVPEYASKQLLRARGVQVPAGALCATVDEALSLAGTIGYPVVIKAQSASLPHKSDVGGVIVGIHDESQLRSAWTQLHERVSIAVPELVLDGILVESMGAPGVELVVGAKRDATWGPVLMVGLGGVWIEALSDVFLLPAHATQRQIIRGLRGLRASALLGGFRGAKPADLEAVAAVVQAVGQLMSEDQDIIEIDVNPVVASDRGAHALDALIVRRTTGTLT